MLALERDILNTSLCTIQLVERFHQHPPRWTCSYYSLLYRTCYKEILQGAHEVDKEALNKTRENAPLLAALISIYESNILNYSSNCIIAYSKAMENFIFTYNNLKWKQWKKCKTDLEKNRLQKQSESFGRNWAQMCNIHSSKCFTKEQRLYQWI